MGRQNAAPRRTQHPPRRTRRALRPQRRNGTLRCHPHPCDQRWRNDHRPQADPRMACKKSAATIRARHRHRHRSRGRYKCRNRTSPRRILAIGFRINDHALPRPLRAIAHRADRRRALAASAARMPQTLDSRFAGERPHVTTLDPPLPPLRKLAATLCFMPRRGRDSGSGRRIDLARTRCRSECDPPHRQHQVRSRQRTRPRTQTGISRHARCLRPFSSDHSRRQHSRRRRRMDRQCHPRSRTTRTARDRTAPCGTPPQRNQGFGSRRIHRQRPFAIRRRAKAR